MVSQRGFSHLTESGVGDMALQLESDAGFIQVRVDQQNQQPDLMFDVQDLDLDYVAAVVLGLSDQAHYRMSCLDKIWDDSFIGRSWQISTRRFSLVKRFEHSRDRV